MMKIYLFILSASMLLFPFSGHAQMSVTKTLLEKDSRYQHLTVVEDTEKKERYLRTDKSGLRRGGIYLDAPDSLLLEYTEMSFIGLAYLKRDPSDALFIGLGTGTMPRYLNRHYPGTRIDVSEIDPDVLLVAQRFFSFRENQDIKVHIADGRAFLSRTPRKYDIIFLDAYQSGSLPYHLTTIEFLGELRKRLKSDGILVANIQTSVITKAFHSVLKTYRRAFPQVEIYTGRNSPNTVFVAGPGSVPLAQTTLVQRAREIRSLRRMDIDLCLYSSYRMYFSAPASDTSVIADAGSAAQGDMYLKVGSH